MLTRAQVLYEWICCIEYECIVLSMTIITASTIITHYEYDELLDYLGYERLSKSYDTQHGIINYLNEGVILVITQQYYKSTDVPLTN